VKQCEQYKGIPLRLLWHRQQEEKEKEKDLLQKSMESQET